MSVRCRMFQEMIFIDVLASPVIRVMPSEDVEKPAQKKWGVNLGNDLSLPKPRSSILERLWNVAIFWDGSILREIWFFYHVNLNAQGRAASSRVPWCAKLGGKSDTCSKSVRSMAWSGKPTFPNLASGSRSWNCQLYSARVGASAGDKNAWSICRVAPELAWRQL